LETLIVPDAAFPPGSQTSVTEPRVLLIAENASYRFGGEGVLPLHYFRVMRQRGMPVWMILNERNRAELETIFSPEDMSHLMFVPDGAAARLLVRIAGFLPNSLASFTCGQIMEVMDQRRSVKLASRFMATHGFTVCHQPTPVSPKHVTVLWNKEKGGLGIPLVMGPMNGGITYPKPFRSRENLFDRVFVTIGRSFAGLAHTLFPGKRRAETLMVANTRTRNALPSGVRGKIEHVVENGVDLTKYKAAPERAPRDPSAPVKLVFAGRLVLFKGVDLLLRALAEARRKAALHLDILGDGPMAKQWKALCTKLNLDAVVTFHGWMSHDDCADRMRDADLFVLPSLRESGGAVVLEAMAMRLPVVAANWGGPADYIDPTCGVLVDVESESQFISAFANALVDLAQSPERRRAMGNAGYAKVLNEYDWERKVDRVIDIYREAMTRGGVSQASRVKSQPADVLPVAS
jgi:glycosyltransferase involved in cell wall biosynthesis